MDPFTIVAIVGIILGSLIVLFTIGNAIRLHMIRSKASPLTEINVDTPLYPFLSKMDQDLTTTEFMQPSAASRQQASLFFNSETPSTFNSQGYNPDSVTSNPY